MDMRNVGGTPGGTRTFFLGIVMIIIGGYLLFDHVQVHGGFWNWRGIGGYGQSFGIVLIPLLLGIAILFVNGKSLVGRVLTGGGFLLILVGIIANLNIHFQRTSLFNTLMMLVLLVGGIGLVVRSVMPMGEQPLPQPRDPGEPDRPE
jgi:multisubunit Na+/H+ antiporter MnhF subunit